jgi:cytoskeletal protein RodZ
MRTLGETLKDARKSKNISRLDLERETKIRRSFLEAIESNNWQNLPEYPVVQGFVRSIVHVLELDEQVILSLLRRDYPQKNVSLAPKPDVKNKFIWSPKWTLLAGALLVTLVIGGYLGYQYKQFISPPSVTLTKPRENEEIKPGMYVVEGKTNLDATIMVNNQPTVVSEDGNFVEEIEITKDTKEVVVVATSRSGKVTEIQRKVKIKAD